MDDTQRALLKSLGISAKAIREAEREQEGPRAKKDSDDTEHYQSIQTHQKALGKAAQELRPVVGPFIAKSPVMRNCSISFRIHTDGTFEIVAMAHIFDHEVAWKPKKG